jgi:outer membrane receptor protein involved in Fe transport
MNIGVWPMALAMFGLLTASAQAEDLGELQELLGSNVVTAASQTAETANVAPATTSNITGEALRQYGIHTLEEAVNFLALGVTSAGRNFHGRPAELGARGVAVPNDDGNHFLVLLNGHHVNEPGMGAARFDRLAAIPLELVDHIEVLVGPGSVLYGNNAMLGVINVVTKKAENFAGTHVLFEGGIADSLRAGAGAGYEFKLFRQQAELTAAVEYFLARGPELRVRPHYIGEDPSTGDPIRTAQAGEATGIWGGTVSSDSNHLSVPSGLLRLRIGDWTLNLHGKMSHRGNPEFLSFDAAENWTQENSLWGDLSYSKLLTPMVDFTARLYADGFEQKAQRVGYGEISCRNLPPCRSQQVRTSRWLGLELRTSLDWLQDRRLVTMLGVDGRLRDVRRAGYIYALDSEALKLPSQGVLSHQDAVFGVYLQQIYKPGDWLALNFGGRLDYDSRFKPVLTPRAAVVSSWWQGATARAVYAEAFRAPSYIETNLQSEGYVKPSLKPERVRSAELSLEQRLGTHRLLLAGFWSKWSGLVGPVVLSQAERERLIGRELNDLLGPAVHFYQRRNIAQIESTGLNAGYEGSALSDKLSFALNATVARSRQKDAEANEHRPATVPRLFGNVRVGYALPGRLPQFGVAAHYVHRRPADYAFDGGFTPRPYAPPQLELRGTLSGPVGNSGLSYRLIGNYAFADRGPYVFGPLTNSVPATPAATLNPVDQFEIHLGLQYDLF